MKTKLSLLALAFLTACGGGGGSSAPSTPVTPAPTIQITLSAPKIFIGDTVKISWTSTNATTCTGVEGFAGIQPISGTINFTPTAGGQFKYTLRCSGAGGTVDSAQTVIVEEILKTFSNTVIKNPDGSYIGKEQAFSAGEFIFNTGIWGASATSYYTVSQNAQVNVRDSIATLNSDWDITPGSGGFIMFDNVAFGKHPGWTSSTTSKLPVQVNAMPDVRVSGTVKTTCLTICGFGTILDVFVMSTPNATTTDIGTEFLIGTERNNSDPDPKYQVGITIINGQEFRVYRNAFPSTWNTIIYAPVIQYSNVSLNMKDFMNDAISRGYIKPADYLVSIEIGTEVFFGKGNINISDLRIH